MRDDPISFWLFDGLAWIKPTGHGCYLNAPGMKAFAKEMMLRGYHNFTVDLGECSGMDETFVGTLAGMALRLRELGRGNLKVVRCTPELAAQLRSLGLEQLFDI